MNNRISKVDNISIYRRAGIKALRGVLKKPFLKRADGLLMESISPVVSGLSLRTILKYMVFAAMASYSEMM